MTRDEIISMAREAGFEQQMQHFRPGTIVLPDALFIRFAALVAAREREACAELVEKGVWAGCWIDEARELSEEVAEAIRARADNDPNRLPSHRCSSLCSPDETFCAITKDGKCDAMDRSCDAARVGHEVTK